MNRSIVRLFGVLILMFAVLVVWTSRWTVFSATALNNNSLNQLQFFASLKVKRGTILAADGHTVLARSVRQSDGTWKRIYPYGSLYAQVVGYAIPAQHRYAGLESAHNSALTGPRSALTSLFGSFNGTPKVGDDVYSTIDPSTQVLARQLIRQVMSAYGATSGSVVAIVPQTGAVKVMYSSPSYNDNHPDRCKPPGCQEFFDAVQGGYPPGSTFKLITTTAALDSGRFTPDSVFNGNSPVTISGHSLQNDSNYSYGQVTLTKALTDSINTVYGPLGLTLGAPLMQKYMQRFGFFSIPPLDYPAIQMAASGPLFFPGPCNASKTSKLLPVTNPCVDLGRTSIGQDKLAVTPLQMAMVVSAIANDGKLMQPRLTSKVVNNAGQTVQRVSPQEDDQVMKPNVAAELQAMMRDVVEEGTATTVNFPGLPIAGKTGTASTGATRNGQPLDDAWFVGFPEQDPKKIAVAVELTGIENGFGGTYAAPIAAKVIQRLLAEHQ
ncbi:MAG: penicillin-binding protein 2 [Acidobacteriota bacterium]|nr:penicillin-binding protein 2 [Acidobacteriota bacterium]